ncbi:hypothetical protein LENED_004096 [Lentinula edodes]|uniref:Uncharacterized protein n=1 Tax=Lentinula edodes TaxID=5353 RepID=A0A1Q3E5K1_LENED|nr:hypothetical protein LENED_004096 [Lentinula edodes]
MNPLLRSQIVPLLQITLCGARYKASISCFNILLLEIPLNPIAFCKRINQNTLQRPAQDPLSKLGTFHSFSIRCRNSHRKLPSTDNRAPNTKHTSLAISQALSTEKLCWDDLAIPEIRRSNLEEEVKLCLSAVLMQATTTLAWLWL